MVHHQTPLIMKKMKVHSNISLVGILLKPGTDTVFDIPSTVLHNGTMDTVVINANISWSDLRFHLAEAMVKPA